MKRILVIGDSCIDVFNYGMCERICPEAPVPVFQPVRNVMNSGMTSNVFLNLKALNIECDIVTNAGTPKKIRYVDEISNQMFLRVDKNDKIKRIARKKLEEINFGQYDAIVISDYNKGFLNETDIEYISNQHSLTFLDTKKNLGNWCGNITFIKINNKEYEENKEYLENGHKHDFIVTKGNKGAILIYKTLEFAHRQEFLIKKEHDVRDLSGAGDTFLAGLVAKFIENCDICEAIEFANKCASWVVTQKGVTIVDINKIK